MIILKSLNSGIAFGLELSMLAAFGYWGYWYGESSWLRWVLAIGIPVIVIIIWGLFFAPKSTRRLKILPGAFLSLGLFLLSAVALYFTNQVALAIVMGIVAVVNRMLVLIWRQW